MYKLIIYGDHDPLLEIPREYDTLEEAEEAKDMIWVSIEEVKDDCGRV